MKKIKSFINLIINNNIVNKFEMVDEQQKNINLLLIKNDLQNIVNFQKPLFFSEFKKEYLCLNNNLSNNFDFSSFIKDYQINEENLVDFDFNSILTQNLYNYLPKKEIFKRKLPNYDLTNKNGFHDLFFMSLPSIKKQKSLGFDENNPVVDYKIHYYLVGEKLMLHFQFVYKNNQSEFYQAYCNIVKLKSSNIINSFSLGNKIEKISENQFHSIVKNSFYFWKKYLNTSFLFRSYNDNIDYSNNPYYLRFKEWIVNYLKNEDQDEQEKIKKNKNKEHDYINIFSIVLFKSFLTFNNHSKIFFNIAEYRHMFSQTEIENINYLLKKESQENYMIRTIYFEFCKNNGFSTSFTC